MTDDIALFRYLFRWVLGLDIRTTQLENRMADVSADQAHVDNDVAALTDSLVKIELEINQLKLKAGAGEPFNFAALDALVARVKGDEPVAEPVPAPVVDPAPAPAAPDVPATPVDITPVAEPAPVPADPAPEPAPVV